MLVDLPAGQLFNYGRRRREARRDEKTHIIHATSRPRGRVGEIAPRVEDDVVFEVLAGGLLDRNPGTDLLTFLVAAKISLSLSGRTRDGLAL
jgi:hypothetical protein